MAADTSDNFQKLEEKLYRALSLFRENEKARKDLEKDLAQLRREMISRDRQHEKELAALRREREEIRSRLGKLIQRISTLTGPPD